MLRHDMVEIVGKEFLTSNIEAGEYSYVQAAGGKAQLEAKVGHPVSHFKLDIRFEMDDVVVLIETKQNYVDDDEKQLREYLEEERAIHPGNKAICVLANTNNDKIKVWKSFVDDEHVLKDEAMLDRMAHYVRLFRINKSNDRETVLRNTYSLNELLHKKDIDENLRSQFVGTSLLYIKDLVKKKGTVLITKEFVDSMKEFWSLMTPKGIRGAIEGVLSDLLDDSDNKAKKIELLQKNVLGNQKVRALKTTDWVEILETIMLDIYRYIDTDSSEGQDILNMFFIAFNKYTGKADKNQAFTPDHITEFMCRAIQHNADGTPFIDVDKKYSDDGYVPDWKFMEDYIKSLNHKPLTTQNNYETVELKVVKWKEFRLGNLIQKPYKAKAFNKDELEETTEQDFGIHYITRTSENNGCELIVNKKDIPSEFVEEGNAISIGDTTATCFYQADEFITGDHMVVVRAEWLNKLLGMFIVSILQKEQYKYSYGRAFLMERISDTIIKLPVQHNTDGTIFIDDKHKYSEEGYVPDWHFMEDYIKSLPYGDKL